MTQERPPFSDDDEARDRLTTNIFLIVMFIVLVGGGYWMVDALLKARDADNCIGQGGRGCGQQRIEAPSR